MLVYILIGFGAFALILVLLSLFFDYRIRAFEGFDSVDPTAFKAKITPGGNAESSSLHPGGAFDPATEKIVESAALPAMSTLEAEANWGKMTSEVCYRSDIGESLKPTRNYLQRTNNYQRSHPDDCSAPNHEFVGTFYKPFDGVGDTPASGTNFPLSTAGCPTGAEVTGWTV